MRKVILNVAVSLDGLIEGPNGEYDWCLTDQDYGMAEFVADTDAIFIGRKSYELIVGDTNEFFNKKKYVFSDKLSDVEGDAEIVTSDKFHEAINCVRNNEGKNIWLFGGASLLSAFIAHGYIDELFLAVHPIVLGKGKPLFENLSERLNLTLLDSKVYSSGLVQLRYSVVSR